MCIVNELVSIITPSYRTASYIKETIESVLRQTYQNWEMIIVDDCSNDGTDEVVAPYLEDKRIRYLKNEKNCGAAISRNRALREAKGRWIAFLDSDDLWFPEKLEKQIAFMQENGYAFSYTGYREINEASEYTGTIVSGPKKITKNGMYAYCWVGCLTVMYDRNVVGLIQIQDIRKNNDYAMWIKVCQKADCYLLDEELAEYRKRAGSISRHGVMTMIGWHYRLWHEAVGKNLISAVFFTGLNMVCGLYKKINYVKNN